MIKAIVYKDCLIIGEELPDAEKTAINVHEWVMKGLGVMQNVEPRRWECSYFGTESIIDSVSKEQARELAIAQIDKALDSLFEAKKEEVL